MLLFLFCLCVVREVGAGKIYLKEAFFEPEKLGFDLLESRPRRLRGDGNFNPSIARLPRPLNFTGGGATNATYVVAFRHKDHSCALLKEESNVTERELRSGAHGTTFEILDDSFEHVADVTTDGHLWFFDHTDARIESFSEKWGDRLLVTATRYHHKSKEMIQIWNARWLRLYVDNATNDVTFFSEPVLHPDIQGNSEIWRQGKNFGVLYEGGQEPFQLLHWLTAGRVDVRRGIPPPPFPDDLKPITIDDALNSSISAKSLSNNGSPVELANGLLLAVGHFHTDTSVPYDQTHTATRGTTKYGNTYLHTFVLFQRHAPFAHCATSRPFCFPALDDPAKCEIIQFVMSIIRLPGNKNDTLLLSYGVNDCEAATVELTDQQILDFIYSSSSSKKRNTTSDDTTSPGFLNDKDPACLNIR